MKDDECLNEKCKLISSAIESIFYALYLISLKDDTMTIIKGTCDRDLFDEQGKLKASKVLKAGAERVVAPLYRKQMLSFNDFSTLDKRLEGEKYISADYLSAKRNVWCRSMFFPLEWDDTGKLTYVLQTSVEIEDSKKKEIEEFENIVNRIIIERDAADLTSDTTNIFVGIISLEDRVLSVIDALNEKNSNNCYDFDELMQRDAKYVINEDHEAFAKKIQLSNIYNEIRVHDTYTFIVRFCKISGNIRWLKYTFSLYRKIENTILMVVEDVTDLKSKDQLTNALSLVGFERYLEQYKLNSNFDNEPIICYFNIIDFRAFNSYYGYSKGDDLIKKVIGKISASRLYPKVVCREMADRIFCVVEKENFSLDCINELCNMYIDDNLSVFLRCGIYYVNTKLDTSKDMCDKARLALEDCVRSQLHNYKIFDLDIENRYAAKLRYLTRLDEALLNHEFYVAYQPIYDVKDNSIAFAEALVRWKDSNGRDIMPREFIPLLEKEGHMWKIDSYVDNEVRLFQKERIEKNLPFVPVTVNISRKDIANERNVKKMIERLDREDGLNNLVCYELTESAFLSVNDWGNKYIDALKNKGYILLIDDFGIGYSSIENVIKYNFQIVKLDMAFARMIGQNKRAETIIKIIVSATHDLGAKIIAEGVETEEQYQFLKAINCDYIQGFYFSKPLPKEEFERKLG